jgi:hypothetical protein
MCIQTFVTETPIERLQKGIIDRFSGAREVQLHLILVSPAVQNLRDELRAVVHPNGTRGPTDGRDPRHRLDSLLSLDTLSDVDHQCFAGEVINHCQRAEPTTIEQCVGHSAGDARYRDRAKVKLSPTDHWQPWPLADVLAGPH